jgi:hypothetical protein
VLLPGLDGQATSQAEVSTTSVWEIPDVVSSSRDGHAQGVLLELRSLDLSCKSIQTYSLPLALSMRLTVKMQIRALTVHHREQRLSVFLVRDHVGSEPSRETGVDDGDVDPVELLVRDRQCRSHLERVSLDLCGWPSKT